MASKETTVTVKSVTPPRHAEITFGRYYFRPVAEQTKALYCMETEPDGTDSWYVCGPDGEPCFPVRRTTFIIRE